MQEMAFSPLEAALTGLFMSVITAIFVKVWLNGKAEKEFVTKNTCRLNHEPIMKLTSQVQALVEVLVLSANISPEEKKQILNADGNG